MEKFPQPAPERKRSGVDRVVGVSPEDEAGIKSYFANVFERADLDAYGKEPSKELQEIYTELNEHLQSFLKEYGIEPLSIPLSRINILDKEKLPPEQRDYIEQSETDAVYTPRLQRIVVFKDWGEGTKLGFLQKLAHEMIHVQAFESWQSLPEEKRTERDLMLGKGDQKAHLGLRRVGFRIMGRDGQSVYFHDVDEAITTELTMRFDWEYFRQFPELSREIEERDGAIEAFAKKNNSSIEEERRHLAEIESEPMDDGRIKSHLKGYSYDQEREALMNLCEDISRQNQEQFPSSEEVFKEFAKAALTGRLLPIARVIEGTYGKGSFRDFGEETSQKGSSDIAS